MRRVLTAVVVLAAVAAATVAIVLAGRGSERPVAVAPTAARQGSPALAAELAAQVADWKRSVIVETTVAGGAAVESQREPRSAFPQGTNAVVRALRADGTPAAGAAVTLAGSESGGFTLRTVCRLDACETTVERVVAPVLTRTADEQGRVLLSAEDIDELTGGGRRSPPEEFRIRAELGGEFGVGRQAIGWVRKDSPDHDTLPVVTIQLRPGVRVAGTVVDEDGAPVARATCSLSWPADADARRSSSSHDDMVPVPDVECGADGRFTFSLLPPIDPESAGALRVSAPGFAHVEGVVEVPGTGDAAIVVRLEHRLTIRGRCVDSADRPVVGARIAGGTGAWTSPCAHTGNDGRFALDAMRPADRRIAIQSRDLPSVGVTIPGDGRHDVDLGDIVIPNGVTLRARIVDADGAPVAWSIVDILPRDGAPWSHADRTDASGRFEREQMPPGYVRLVVHHPRCSAGAILSVTGVRTGTHEDVRVVLPRLPEFVIRSSAPPANVRSASTAPRSPCGPSRTPCRRRTATRSGTTSRATASSCSSRSPARSRRGSRSKASRRCVSIASTSRSTPAPRST